jgi:hypothetical protein
MNFMQQNASTPIAHSGSYRKDQSEIEERITGAFLKSRESEARQQSIQNYVAEVKCFLKKTEDSLAFGTVAFD